MNLFTQYGLHFCIGVSVRLGLILNLTPCAIPFVTNKPYIEDDIWFL